MVENTFFPYIALISAFAAQIALLGFIFSSLHLSWNVSPYGRGLFPCMSERERGKKKEEDQKAHKKLLCRDRDLSPRTLSPEPSVLSIRPRHPAQFSFVLGHVVFLLKDWKKYNIIKSRWKTIAVINKCRNKRRGDTYLSSCFWLLFGLMCKIF